MVMPSSTREPLVGWLRFGCRLAMREAKKYGSKWSRRRRAGILCTVGLRAMVDSFSTFPS